MVGANQHYSSQGAVYAYTRASEEWSLETKFTASDGVDGDNFGQSIGLFRNWVHLHLMGASCAQWCVVWSRRLLEPPSMTALKAYLMPVVCTSTPTRLVAGR